MLKLLNRNEVDNWIFQHAVIQGHIVDSIQGTRTNPYNGKDEIVNISYKDRKTGEFIRCDWDCVQRY